MGIGRGLVCLCKGGGLEQRALFAGSWAVPAAESFDGHRQDDRVGSPGRPQALECRSSCTPQGHWQHQWTKWSDLQGRLGSCECGAGRVFASVPEATVMDVYNAVSDI